MKFNRKKFFDGFRARIDPTIEQEQVDGLEFLLTQMESDRFWKFIPQIAYALATVYHETAGSFQPVEEGYYLGSKARVKAFQKKLRYFPYYGRGYVQLTWKRNYEKADRELFAYGTHLAERPETALDPKISYLILTYGMHQGWFTGKKLDDYIKGEKKDYVNARRIINGTDKAGLIAGYAREFEKILRDSATTPAANDPATSPDSGAMSEHQQAVPATLPEPSPSIPEIPVVPLVPTPEPAIPVESVTAEKEDPIDKSINKWSSRFVAVPAAALSFVGGAFSWLTSSPVHITVTLIIVGGVIAALYFGIRMVINSRDKARKDKLQAEREQRAHEIMLLTMKAASDPNMNTIKVVAPPTTEIANSDNPANADAGATN